MDDRGILCSISSILIYNIYPEGVYGSNGSLQYLRTARKAEYLHVMWEFSMFPVHDAKGCMYSLFSGQVIFWPKIVRLIKTPMHINTSDLI
jgi:hypothetical protein